MHIHFVCSGNVYRSRLAEAYFKSKLKGDSISVSSSGIMAGENKYQDGPIGWYAMRLLKHNNLVRFMSWSERQTTAEILKGVDFLVCMRPMHLNFCRSIGYAGKDAEVWDIPDLNEMPGYDSTNSSRSDLGNIRLTEETYRAITEKADGLLERLTKI